LGGDAGGDGVVSADLDSGETMLAERVLIDLHLGQTSEANFGQQATALQRAGMFQAKIVEIRAASGGRCADVEEVELVSIPVQQIQAALIQGFLGQCSDVPC
jgi:hypothetical protein